MAPSPIEIALLEGLSFDSESFPPASRFEQYRLANRGGADAYEVGPNFRAKVQRWRLERIVIHERWFNDVVHERIGARAAQDGVEHFMLTVVLSGGYEVDSGQGFKRVTPGHSILIDMAETMRSRAQNAHVITLSLPREMVEGARGDSGGLHGTVLASSDGGLLADLLRSIAARAPQLAMADVPGITRALTALLSVAFDRWSQPRDPAEGFDADEARFQRARQRIEQLLGHPQFGPAALVAQLGVSRATLYRLFKPYGGLQNYIQRRRLDRVRVALSRPENQRPFPLVAAEAGFASESHCSRLFLEVFGVRPGEYRAEVAGEAPLAGTERRIDYWIRDLH